MDDADAFYADLVGMGIRPAGKPADSPSGKREFIIRDPDGYQLVAFKRH